MANNRILLKKSSVPDKVPGVSDIEFGEVALNFSDGRLYFKNSDNNIDFFESGVGSSSTLPFAANEANFGSVTNTSSEFEFNLGSINETETFTHDLGIVEAAQTGTTQDLTLFENDFDLGSVVVSTESSFDFGLISNSVNQELNLGNLVTSGAIFPNVFVLPSSSVSALPEGITGQMIFVTDEVNGAAPAFFDGSDWKRLSDNQIVSTV